MASKKKLLQASAGVSAGGGGAVGLNVEEVFSTWLYEGNGNTQSIQNDINIGQSFGSGSLELDSSGGYVKVQDTTSFDVGSSDDYTVEMWVYFVTDPNNSTIKYLYDGKASTASGGSEFFLAQESHNGWSTDDMNGSAFSSTDFTEGQWYHVAITRSGGAIRSFKNGALINTVYSNTSSFDTDQFTIGARYTNNYILNNAYISNFRFVNGTALYTSGFTVPTSELTAVTNTALLTLQGTTPLVDNSTNANTVTAYGTTEASTFGPFDAASSGEGGLVWIKSRTEGTYGGHALYDTERGATNPNNVLSTSGDSGVTATAAEYTSSPSTSDLTSFNANGFSLGPDNYFTKNTNGEDYASWTWRKAPKFFDIQTWTGNGVAGRQISHNLGSVPGMIIVKAYSHVRHWAVYHKDIGNNNIIFLSKTDGASTSINWNNTTPTDSVITLGSGHNVNGNNYKYVAYIFAHHNGDGDFGPDANLDAIKCGSFTGTGATNNFVNLGWEPQWIMFKNTASSEEWFMFDNMRETSAYTDKAFYADLYQAEGSAYDNIDFNATGFTLKDTYWGNRSGDEYIFLAVRRGPMAVPTDATDVFAVDYPQSAPVTPYHFKSGFPVDFALQKFNIDSSGTYGTPVPTRLLGVSGQPLNATSTAGYDSYTGQAVGAGSFEFTHNEGYFGANHISTPNDIAWMWRRAPGFCDVLTWTGDGTAGRTVSHNLGVAPEMMWIKRYNTLRLWSVYHKDLGPSDYLLLNTSDAEGTGITTLLNDTDPTSSVITLGSGASTNGSGSDYVAYLFASLDGVSKVGSFTMAGSDINVDCGFSSGARFVLLKRTDSTGNWLVFDSERGIVAGADPYLLLNTTDAEDTFGALDIIDPLSSGFTAVSANIANGDWIFYAIA